MPDQKEKRSVGTVYWITGLSGSGKSTIGSLLCKRLRQDSDNVVYLDGDVLRSVFGNKNGHSIEERHDLAMQYARLCQMLSQQGMQVVCATISMFKDVRDWNRNNISDYKEIYLKVPIDVLIKRDQKGLYSRAMRKEIDNIIGIDLPFEEPDNSDIVLVNDGTHNPEYVLGNLLEALSC
eukprot:TRINITY_DN6197_c0_g1_i1.p7 TRINITY_DN6197_c0_g1~~TRINITY_DN6197_c0_g1_i1.p7  ORF type:complete len:179 (-),score=4.89 TRINITY_DN6197_c0_g1_i1:4146-4682(-)